MTALPPRVRDRRPRKPYRLNPDGSPNVEDVLPKVELLVEDGIPLESNWHVLSITLLIELTEWINRGREDYYTAGNMFIYFDEEQAKNRNYRGPDFFFLDGVPHDPIRQSWVVWEEGGRYPDVIFELCSQSTKDVDETTKKDIYERTFKTQDYFIYDPDTETLKGWHLVEGKYQPLEPNEHGRLWCAGLGVWVGLWDGAYKNRDERWVRFFDNDGNLIPTFAEAEAAAKVDAQQQAEAERERADAEQQRAETERQRAETERQRADAERQRADAERQRAEAFAAEVERLTALLAARQPDNPS